MKLRFSKDFSAFSAYLDLVSNLDLVNFSPKTEDLITPRKLQFHCTVYTPSPSCVLTKFLPFLDLAC